MLTEQSITGEGDGEHWVYSITPGSSWETIEIPFSDFKRRLDYQPPGQDMSGTLDLEKLTLPRQWLGVPLQNGEGEKIGALVTYRYHDDQVYGEEDRKILNFVSSQIAMAIERKLNEDELRRKNQQLSLLTEGTILALVRSVEIRDPYTAGHQQRVSLLAREIGRKLGLREDKIEAIRIAALLHDVGKIAVPTELLSKPGKLSEIEMMLIRQHPVESYNILRNIQFPFPIAQYVLEHHEKYNGSGYPAGLKSDAISLESRIICGIGKNQWAWFLSSESHNLDSLLLTLKLLPYLFSKF